MFEIPKGLRPVRINVAQDSTPRPETAPEIDSAAVRGADKATQSRWESGRAYSMALAKKLRHNRRMALPRPRHVLCCCLRVPKVKDERTASFAELSKLFLLRDENQR